MENKRTKNINRCKMDLFDVVALHVDHGHGSLATVSVGCRIDVFFTPSYCQKMLSVVVKSSGCVRDTVDEDNSLFTGR